MMKKEPREIENQRKTKEREMNTRTTKNDPSRDIQFGTIYHFF